MGARKFAVSDVGPLGCIPYVRALKFMPAGECSASANRVTVGYNKKLKTMVGKMNREMGPDSKFVYTNTYDIVTEIIQRYRQYGTLFFARGSCCFLQARCFRAQNGIPPVVFGTYPEGKIAT
jgi:hypothetical protein